MATFENKDIATTYGDILQCNNGGTGRTTNGTIIQDGKGNGTCLRLGENRLGVRPIANDAIAFTVGNASGSTLIEVDTVDDEVKLGSSQTYANTQIQRFVVVDGQPTADTHTSMMLDGVTSHLPITFGTGIDPATTYSLSASEANASALTMSMWYIPVAITIDEVRVIASGEASDTVNFHLFQYTLATGTGTGAGDLSSGTVVASTGSPLTIDNDRVTTTTLTKDDPTVDANKVIIATFENVGATTDVHAQLIVKYHYQ